MSSYRRTFPIASKILLVFFGIFLALAILEIALRLCGFGYKVLNPLPKNRGADYRIFCLGESTTAGVGTDNPSQDGYPRQLETLLSGTFPDKKIQCLFGHTIGINSSEMLLKFPEYIEAYNPDLVIIMAGTNNWWNLERSNILLFSRNSFVSNLTFRFIMFLERFRTWRFIRWITYSTGIFKARFAYWSPEKLDEVVKRDGEDMMMLFNNIACHDITEMVKVARANNIKVIIANYPMGSYGNLGLLQAEIAHRFNLPFVDNEAVFEDLSPIGAYISGDGWHPNKKGYGVVARNFYDCIMENNLIS